MNSRLTNSVQCTHLDSHCFAMVADEDFWFCTVKVENLAVIRNHQRNWE